MQNDVFRTLLDLWMVSDPWPLTGTDDEIFTEYLLSEARIRGYDSLTVAYHEHEREVA